MGRPKKVKEETKKVEPIVLEMGKAIEGKSFKGETFEIVKTTHGILYHLFGGYNIFVTPNNIALYETLNNLIENKDEYEKLTGKEREDFDLNLSAVSYVLDVPLLTFGSAEFTFHLASEVIKYLQSVYDKATQEPLQEETVEYDLAFKDAVLGLEQVQNALKEK